MLIKSGDLISHDGRLGVVVSVVESSVFEGGEKCKMLSVLFSGEQSLVEVMSWGVQKVNS